MSDLNQKRCFICGEYGADSRDHVPPKGTLPKGYRGDGGDLITVPAHVSCNREQHLDDDYLRVQLALLGFGVNEQGDALHAQVMSSLEREQAQRFRGSIDSEFIDAEVRTSSGIVLPGVVAKNVDTDRLLKVVERTARGIHYNRTGNMLPLDWPVATGVADPAKAPSFIQYLGPDDFESFASGSFRFRWLLTSPDSEKKDSIFFFVFYDSVYFYAISGSPASTNATSHAV